MKGLIRWCGEFLTLAAAAVLLAIFLFADSSLAHSATGFSWITAELMSAFRDAGIQWIVLACACVYFIAFNLLHRRQAGFSFWRAANPLLWLALLLGLIAYTFFSNYGSAASNTQALLLAGGASLGCGAFVWSKWHPERSVRVLAKGIGMFVILLVIGTLLGADPFLEFQYRGQQRSSGLWDNPNTFGILMGGGVALALGALVQGLRFKVQSCPTELNIEHRKWMIRAWRWMKVLFFITAAGVMFFGLIKSYSRGAWLGAGVGIGFLIYQVIRSSDFQVQWTRLRNVWISCALVVISIGLMTFWNARHVEQLTLRRALSVANANDFSWRKRLAAYEGALQMITDKPWFGFGWNQPEPIYDRFYRKPKVDEGMAIQMNDYFMLGATLGIPALGCFIAYIYLSLQGREHRTSNIEHPTSKGSAECGMGNAEHPTLNSQLSTFNEERWLRITCQAGAIVLLVGFFFDGGLFKLATGSTFWILISLGSEPIQRLKSNVQSRREAVPA